MGLTIRDCFILIFLGYHSLGVNGDDWTLTLNPEGKIYNKFVHDSFYVNCYHSNATGITWFKNNQEIPKTRDRIHVEPGLDNNGLSLVFTDMEVSDVGNYTCKAKINNRQVQTAFSLIVFTPITFADTSAVQTANEGETFSIRCEARGDPEPTISWLVPGRRIGSPQYKKLGDGLSITKVTREDGNLTYICRAMQLNSDVPNFREQIIKLNVLYRPTWKLNKTATVYGYFGGTANVTCEVEANPPANFTWYNSVNRQISPTNDVKITHENNKSILSIFKFSRNATGNYKCKAKNVRGEFERTFNLKEGPKPVPPKKTLVHSATHNSLKLEIHSSDEKGFEIKEFRVEILEKKDRERGKGWEVAKVVKLPKGKSNTYVINDLSPKTEYLIRVHSINAAGPSDYTDELKAQTSNSAKVMLSNALIFLVLFVCRYT